MIPQQTLIPSRFHGLPRSAGGRASWLVVTVALTFYLSGFVATAQAQVWTCERTPHSRTIQINYPTGNPLPCEIVYDKSDEGMGVTTPWVATASEGFCEKKVAELIEKHATWGWTCAAKTPGETDLTTSRPNPVETNETKPPQDSQVEESDRPALNTTATQKTTQRAGITSHTDKVIRQHVTNFVYDVKFYLWKNADGALPGDVFSDPPVVGDIDLDGSDDFALLYTIENFSGKTSSNQYLHVFLRDSDSQYRPVSNALFPVTQDAKTPVTIDRIEDGMIHLTDLTSSQRKIKLVNNRLVEIDPVSN